MSMELVPKQGTRGCQFGEVLKLGVGDSRSAVFRASTPALDRHGTVVRSEGIRTDNFQRNPVFGWGHDLYDGASIRSIIGRVIGFDQTSEHLDVEVEFATADVNPDAEMAYRMVKGQYLSMVSIGFMPINAGFQTVEGRELYVYDEVDLLEVSLVPIPANPEAEVIRHALERQYLTPPSEPEADAGVQALRQARMNMEVRTAFRSFQGR